MSGPAIGWGWAHERKPERRELWWKEGKEGEKKEKGLKMLL